MADHSYWLMAALILLGVEMVTGTFYMMVLSLAAALGSVVALAGFAPTWQFSLAGLLAVIGTLALRRLRAARPAALASGNNFDVGQPVKIVRWNDDGTARVHYRGADWDAEPESADTPHATQLYIKAAQGSKLILTEHKP